jgi:L-Ala-D/L-Glu epimerase
MKIKSVKAWPQPLPLTKPYAIAYSFTSGADIVFLQLELENGTRGIGAANPFAEVVGETPALTLANLQQDFVQRLVGRDIRCFNQLIDEALLAYPHMPGTVAAIDIALHDAFCQWLGIRVVDFYGCKKEALPTSFTIGIKGTAAMLEEAADIYAQGFRVIKIKTGLDVEADIERVAKLTEAYRGKMLIRVDANQGYGLPQLQRFLAATAGLAIELVEQPLPVGSESELLQLGTEGRKRLVADESLLDTASAMQLAQPPAPYGVFNIKLMKCGGIRAAREIAMVAAQTGTDLFWGCNDESRVSITAALHAAYSCGNTRYLDLDGSFDLGSDCATGGFVVKEGLLYCADGPGLGLHIIQ